MWILAAGMLINLDLYERVAPGKGDTVEIFRTGNVPAIRITFEENSGGTVGVLNIINAAKSPQLKLNYATHVEVLE